jgi:hypothetical protein
MEYLHRYNEPALWTLGAARGTSLRPEFDSVSLPNSETPGGAILIGFDPVSSASAIPTSTWIPTAT